MEAFTGYRVVTLDRDLKAAGALLEIIRGWGLRAEGFTQLEAAIEYIGRNGCDVVLLDVSILGFMSMSQMLRFGNDIRIILTMQQAEKDKAIRSLKLGAFDLLEKPFQNDLLQHSISRALTDLENERQSNALIEQVRQSRSELVAGWRRLESLNDQLIKMNNALSVLVRNIEREKEKMESQLDVRLRNLLMPLLTRLRSDRTGYIRKDQIDALTWYLDDLTSSLSMGPGIAMSLSSTEMRIASLVRNGASTHEMARQLNISEDTVKSHLRSIRKKLKVHGQHSLKDLLYSRSGLHQQRQYNNVIHMSVVKGGQA
ncbi:putative Two component transcriptional regulator, LuxR family [Syntrophobacter sp. SbD1]|nr:putative Two component transcriptional regulator, LuxR family [Syntrophobacter sp. SbD1]